MVQMWTLRILLLLGGVVAERTCRFNDVVEHLQLKRNSDFFYMSRPVNDYRQPTLVTVEMSLYAILDVMEKEQRFLPYVWTVMKWKNDFIWWNKEDFCGISEVSVPIEVLWKPDISIEEMVEKDKAPHSPFLLIRSNGEVELQSDQVLVITCRMKVYKFPFDTQRCNLSFKSILHEVKDIQLVPKASSRKVTLKSKEVMMTEYEWLFEKITVKNFTTFENQDKVVYTVTMRRRSLLYVMNFLLPVLFFLCLDLASFLISHGAGEKLTFKVTVLLAVTVLQLILNEILPASSNRIPLIAIYCIGIFAMMLLSLLETIVVMYLMKKDLHPETPKEEKEEEEAGCVTEDTRDHNMFSHIFHRGHNHHSSTGETQSGLMDEMHFHQNTGYSTQLTLTDPCKDPDQGDNLKVILDELRRVEQGLRHLRNPDAAGCWTIFAKRLNKVFFTVYVAVVTAFLIYVYLEWVK
uniref:5-hydroxytryptamine receptor 3A-like n=1 Tax=Knipowitschia caucasica TaxID=637954 RepID=A0AAV2LHD9_KNICA